MVKIIVSFFFLSAFSCLGQIEEVKRITKKLCSPELHGRGYVNHGDSIAAAYLVDEFKKLNVAPFKGNYYQSFQLNVNTFPGEMSIVQSDKELIPGTDFVVDPSSRGYKGFLYPEIVTASQTFNLDELRDIVLRVRAQDTKREILVFDYTSISADSLKEMKGIVREVASIVPVVELIDAKFTWSVGREQSYMAYFQIQKSAFNFTVPMNVNVEGELIDNYSTQNVMAYIPSKKRCAKTIMYTAHYDHLGRMGQDTYFPGANDNASGTAMLLTTAKYFKENPSDFNVLLVAFAGEEAGLVGSKFFVENSPIKLKKIRFLVNLDIMGSGEDGVTVVNATLFEDEFKMLQEINEEKKLLSVIKSRGPAANSDHYWFTEKGVPAFFIYTMGPNKHYHDVHDKYEELSFSEYDDITQLLREFIFRLETEK